MQYWRQSEDGQRQQYVANQRWSVVSSHGWRQQLQQAKGGQHFHSNGSRLSCNRARIDAIKARKGADQEAEMDESAATKQGRKLSTMRVDPKANDLTRPTAPDGLYTTAS